MNKLSLTSIGQKLTIIISLVISISFGLIVYFYAQQQEQNIILQNERSMHQVLDSVNQGLQSVMITGSADVAELYAERLKGVKDVDDFRILRINGLEAFKDNETVKRVNEFREDSDFEFREKEEQVRVLAGDDPHLQQSLKTQQFSYFYHQDHGRKHLTFLLPIKSVKKCNRCHGDETPVLGVLKVTSSLNSVETAVRQTWMQAAWVLAASLIAVLVVMTLVLRHYIVQPIELVSAAMKRVAKGDLSQKVPVMGRDELATMAQIFNHMTGELRSSYDGFNSEHNKLQTIIMGTEEGIVVTDGKGKVVLVNPAAEILLGKDWASISAEGFLQLFNDPARMENLIESSSGKAMSADLVLYKERFLAIGASQIMGADSKVSGYVAVIRDMTKVKLLEQKLRALASTDALTGLSNRRALDETLEHEFNLAKEQSRPLSVLMFDVDHFKKFNDNYGHDQGDRVLKAFAVTTRGAVREILDTVCRYGGEEFMVIARETPQNGGMILAERIRKAIEEMRVDGMRVTTSIGVAGILETGAESPGQLIELADAALYRAKEAGRNKSMAAEVVAG